MLKQKLEEQINQLPGDVSLKVKYLNSDNEININESTQFWAASVIKIPIAATFYKQVAENKIQESSRQTVSADNKVEGSGITKLLDNTTDFTTKDLLTLMLVVSDNSATNQLVDLIGWESVEQYMQELGLLNTTFKHKMMIPAGRGPNLTTSHDMAILLEKMYRNEIPGSEQILGIMQEQLDRSRIPLYIPNEVKIAHKNGSLPQAMHEVGIVYAKDPFIFCFLSDDQSDKRKTNEVLSKCAKLCFEYVS